MGFKNGDFPPVDLETFLDRPLMERVKALALHWVDYGFGSPRMIHTTYVVKVLVLYIGLGVALATMTSDVGSPWQFREWWDEPIVYQKFVAWTMLLETVGVAGSWGPLAGKFKPMTGGALFWARVGTIRTPPWPDKVPGTAGDSRTPFDVVLYLALLASLLWPVVAPAGDSVFGLVAPAYFIAPIVLVVLMGLRDKTIFIAARSEQYVPILILCALVGQTDLVGFTEFIVGLKLVIATSWIGAGISKLGKHFSNVVPPMVSNSPTIPGRFISRLHYRKVPDDIRPSGVANFMAHVGGTTVEILVPLTLLFVANENVAIAAALFMVLFHLFIISTFPLAVPLEWNVLFAFGSVFLFIGFKNADGYGIGDADPAFVIGAVVALAFFPVLGNLRPDLVAFTPSMRQYAGNWASALWAFQPGAEAKLDAVIRPTTNQVDQLQAMGYPQVVAEITMQQTLGWRSMHSQGRGLFSLLMAHVEDLDRATVREAEFACNSLLGFNFGDGHLHNHRFIESLQKRCQFAPGEFIVAWVESQPIHKKTQDYMVIDAAVGIIERGTWNVADAVKEQPWLPNGPIPLTVTWRRPADAVAGATR